MNGRKVPNAGWSGAWKILSGSAQAAGAGCAIADGVAGFAGVIVAQENGNFAFVNYADSAIGTNQIGQATNVYTVIVNESFEFVTAFPGFPSYY
jgi:hypothetical protein